jgi:Zn-dependent metalloprotease
MRNITPAQRQLLGELRERDQALRVTWDDLRGVAASVRGRLSSRPQADPVGHFEEFVTRFGALFGVAGRDELRGPRQRADDLQWTHLEFQHVVRSGVAGDNEFGTIEVYGSKLAAHLEPDGTLRQVQSSCWRDIDIPDAIPIAIDPEELRLRVLREIVRAPGYQALRRATEREEDFPLMQRPRLVVYPWQGSFRLAWATYTYAAVPEGGLRQPERPASSLALGQAFFDAGTGELFLFAPTRQHAETPDTGTGSAVTPLGGSFTSRSLNIVHETSTSTYRLRDTTHARDIVTYDASCNPGWVYGSIGPLLVAGTIPVSEDTDGDKNWSQTPATSSDADHLASQQPEVDAHFFCTQLYEWYDALAGGRAGWDDSRYTNPPVAPGPLHILTHVHDNFGGTCRSVNAFHDNQLVSGSWVPYLAFFDGDGATYDYLAGSAFIVGHEYQHAITNYTFEDGAGNPGLTYSSWFAAVHEGLSDVFGGLFAEDWLPGRELSPTGQPFRILAFPRNTTAFDPNKLDHFADRSTASDVTWTRYELGAILAHCAFLMGAGGIHQRVPRMPEHIPVYSLGRETVNGKDVLRAARIWYRALAQYFSTHGALTGIPTNDENTFRMLRDGCVDAAEDLYGAGSCEHTATILAFYAVGLHPPGTSYGADCTFVRWGWDWRLSRPYLGGIYGSSPDWASIDLFVNNGGLSEWNALINVLDSSNNPTQFENTVYCRVRNVGDQPALNVTVQFFYAAAGTSTVTWLPVTDKNGVAQVLNVGTLGAGQSTIADSAQGSPPASAGVKWYIPPLTLGTTVDHFCLRAVVSCTNDVNACNNEVQSNIAYTAVPALHGLHATFMARNPTREEIPLVLEVTDSLPKGWRVELAGVQRGERLRPGGEKEVQLVLHTQGGDPMAPPLDGELRGRLYGPLTGEIHGSLSEVRLAGDEVRALAAFALEELGSLVGELRGTLDRSTGALRGTMVATFQCAGGGMQRVCVGVNGCLRPWRRINVRQMHGREALGGVTVQVQVPLQGPCAIALPPTDTHVTPAADHDGHVRRHHGWLLRLIRWVMRKLFGTR